MATERQTLSGDAIQSMLGRSAFIRFLNLEVVSVDAEREEVVLRSGKKRRRTEGLNRFLRHIRGGGDWAFVALDPPTTKPIPVAEPFPVTITV